MTEAAKKTTPAYTSHKSFINLINDLRENGVPTHISRSVVKGSNSDKSTMSASLKALGLIKEDTTPTQKFKQLVEQQENYSTNLKELIHDAYPFLFDNSIDVANTTTEKVAEKFKEAGASGSTIAKCISFFLAIAKEAGIPVSGRVKAPAPQRSSNGTKKKNKKADAVVDEVENGSYEDDIGEQNRVPEDMEKITVSLRGMSDGVIWFPKDLDGEQAKKAVKLAIFALKNFYDLPDED